MKKYAFTGVCFRVNHDHKEPSREIYGTGKISNKDIAVYFFYGNFNLDKSGKVTGKFRDEFGEANITNGTAIIVGDIITELEFTTEFISLLGMPRFSFIMNTPNFFLGAFKETTSHVFDSGWATCQIFEKSEKLFDITPFEASMEKQLLLHCL